MPSPNMGLTIPVVSTTTGPQYAEDVNASLTKLDAHNHTSCQGVQIPTAGLNINSSVPMNNYGLLNASLINLASQALPPISGSIYRNNDDLYYVDGTGANVRITQGGAVAVSGAVGFSGLPFGTASASYNNGIQSFVFQSATNTAANVDCGSVILRELVAGANGVTLSSPLALAADYTMRMPSALPPTTNFLMMTPLGQVTNNVKPDGTSIQIVGNDLSVIFPASPSPNLVIQDFSFSKVTAGSPFVISGTTITITTSGRPILFGLTAHTTNTSRFSILAPTLSNTTISCFVQLTEEDNAIPGIYNNVAVFNPLFQANGTTLLGKNHSLSPSMFTTILLRPAATYNFRLEVVYDNEITAYNFFIDAAIFAYELR